MEEHVEWYGSLSESDRREFHRKLTRFDASGERYKTPLSKETLCRVCDEVIVWQKSAPNSGWVSGYHGRGMICTNSFNRAGVATLKELEDG